MKCLICTHITFQVICKKCVQQYIKKNISIRNEDGLLIYSMYNFDEYRYLIDSKYYHIGFEIFKIFASHIRGEIDKIITKPIFMIPIDDNVKNGYSHTAIIAKNISSDKLIPIYGHLRAKNHINYAGKNLQFRQKYKKDFYLQKEIMSSINIKDIILVDDIITTGSTLMQARDLLKSKNFNVKFAITLFDAAR